jgi:hypothetical protein
MPQLWSAREEGIQGDIEHVVLNLRHRFSRLTESFGLEDMSSPLQPFSRLRDATTHRVEFGKEEPPPMHEEQYGIVDVQDAVDATRHELKSDCLNCDDMIMNVQLGWI